MKVCFLDIDGIVNRAGCKVFLDGIYFVLDEKLILIRQLLDRTGAKIVLSSTWRHGWEDLKNGRNTRNVKHFLALQEKFREFGMEFLDYTPITNGSTNRRGEEISMWLDTWKGEPIESMVVLDDMSGIYIRPYSSRLVRTSFLKGIEQKHIDMAVKMLEKPLKKKDKEPAPLPGKMVHYRWVPEDEPELFELLEDVTDRDMVCFHCNEDIGAGEPLFWLIPTESSGEYTLCSECAKTACEPV